MLLEREAERAVWPSPFRLYNQVLLVNTKMYSIPLVIMY